MSESDALCPIWKVQAQVVERKGNRTLIKSSRAGGQYWVTDTAEAMLRSRSEPDWREVSLTEEVYLGSQSGVAITIDSTVITELPQLPSLPVEAQFNRFLRLVAEVYPEFGDYFVWGRFYEECASEILAATRSPENSSVGTARQRAALLFEGAFQAGYLIGSTQDIHARISMEGWKHVEAMAAAGFGSKQIFVAMWFGTDEQTRLWQQAIRPAIVNAGYIPMRIDNKEHNEKKTIR